MFWNFSDFELQIPKVSDFELKFLQLVSFFKKIYNASDFRLKKNTTQ